MRVRVCCPSLRYILFVPRVGARRRGRGCRRGGRVYTSARLCVVWRRPRGGLALGAPCPGRRSVGSRARPARPAESPSDRPTADADADRRTRRPKRTEEPKTRCLVHTSRRASRRAAGGLTSEVCPVSCSPPRTHTRRAAQPAHARRARRWSREHLEAGYPFRLERVGSGAPAA